MHVQLQATAEASIMTWGLHESCTTLMLPSPPGLAYAILSEVFHCLGADVSEELHFDPSCWLAPQADICIMQSVVDIAI